MLLCLNQLNFTWKVIVLLLFFISSLYGQDYQSDYTQERLFEFTNRKSNPITVGHLKSIKDKSIVVVDGNGLLVNIPIKSLSKESLKIIDDCRAQDRYSSSKVTEAEKYASKLKSGSDKTKIRNLKKIGGLGSHASLLSRQIFSIAIANENELGITALQTFMKICLGDKESLDQIVNAIRVNRFIRFRIKSNPVPFLSQLSKFQNGAEDILIYSAFNGRFQLEEFDPSLMNTPTVLMTVDEQENKIRAAAAYSLAKINSQRSQEAMFKTVQFAEKIINKKYDLGTIKACYTGCAELGRHVTSRNAYMDFYQKYKHAFEPEARYWLENQKQKIALSLRTEQLRRSSKMKNFNDSHGKFLIRAKIEKIQNEMILVVDSKNIRHTIPISNFSEEHVEWLRKNFR